MSPGRGQSKFKPRKWEDQVKVVASGGASLSPGSGQSRFESRNRQICSNRETPKQASTQSVVYPNII